VELHRNKKIYLRLGRCMLSLVAGNIPTNNNKNSSTVSKIANAASTSVNVLGSAVSKAMNTMILKGNNLANKRIIYFCNPIDCEKKNDWYGFFRFVRISTGSNSN
jgi:hypothetical protein